MLRHQVVITLLAWCYCARVCGLFQIWCVPFSILQSMAASILNTHYPFLAQSAYTHAHTHLVPGRPPKYLQRYDISTLETGVHDTPLLAPWSSYLKTENKQHTSYIKSDNFKQQQQQHVSLEFQHRCTKFKLFAHESPLLLSTVNFQSHVVHEFNLYRNVHTQLMFIMTPGMDFYVQMITLCSWTP